MLPLEIVGVLAVLFAFVLYFMVRRAYQVARAGEREEYGAEGLQEASD
jgi:hypothetical protein